MTPRSHEGKNPPSKPSAASFKPPAPKEKPWPQTEEKTFATAPPAPPALAAQSRTKAPQKEEVHEPPHEEPIIESVLVTEEDLAELATHDDAIRRLDEKLEAQLEQATHRLQETCGRFQETAEALQSKLHDRDSLTLGEFRRVFSAAANFIKFANDFSDMVEQTNLDDPHKDAED